MPGHRIFPCIKGYSHALVQKSLWIYEKSNFDFFHHSLESFFTFSKTTNSIERVTSSFSLNQQLISYLSKEITKFCVQSTFWNFEIYPFPYQYNKLIKMVKQVHSALTGPLVYFQVTVAQMRARRWVTLLISRSEIQIQNIELVFVFFLLKNFSCFIGG